MREWQFIIVIELGKIGVNYINFEIMDKIRQGANEFV